MGRAQADFDLLRRMHSLEKGMALPTPTPGFAREKAQDLLRHALVHRRRFGETHVTQLCREVFESYHAVQSDLGAKVELPSHEALGQLGEKPAAGYRDLDRDEILRAAEIDFRQFCEMRSSVRRFTGAPVPEAVLREVVEIARMSPSVCNRSSGRAYFSNDRSVIDEAIRIQGGGRGFASDAGGVLVIVSDLRSFYSSKERYQCWIDGGLFAMTAAYAIHAAGYGACMLNWSKEPEADRRMRERFDIDDAHNIIMLIAVGCLPSKVRVAASPKNADVEYAIPLRQV
jgi:nitroreductase